MSGPLWLGNSSSSQSYYRCVLPARMTGGTVTPSPDLTTADLDLKRPIVVQGPGLKLDDDRLQLLEDINAAGGNAWIETDDNLAEIPGADWVMQDMRLKWGNAYAERHAAQIRQHGEWYQREVADCFRQAVEAARGVLVTTEPLADIVRAWGSEAVVIPNAIDAAAITPYERPDDGIVTVGFGGHYRKYIADLPPILPGLFDLARCRPHVELHFFGGMHPQFDADDFSDSPRKAGVYERDGVRYVLHRHEPDIVKYQNEIAILDVAVGPLADTSFNRCRSASKWMEHALHETPMVVPNLEPFDPVVHGVTGLKARNSEEFVSMIAQLVDDSDLRRRIGAAAREEVLRNHSLDALRPVWLRWVEDGWTIGNKRR